MKLNVKKALSCLCAAILLVSVSCITGAAAGPQPPVISGKITYCAPVNVTSVEQKAKEFVIHANMAPTGSSAEGTYLDTDFYITFPVTGGFHLRTLKDDTKSGFFDVENIKIEYVTAGDEIRMTGADGTTLSYQKTTSGFVFDVLNKAGTVVQTIRSEDILIGFNDEKQVVKTKVVMPLRADEAIYNGCERFNAVRQYRKKLSLYNTDAAYHGSASASSDHTNSYNTVPLFHSTDGYSIWYDMTYPGTADIGAYRKTLFSVEFQGENLDFYMWSGTILENIKKYTDITGTSIVPPKWVFGYWLGATSGAWSGGSVSMDYNESQVPLHDNAHTNLIKLFDGHEAMGITDIAAVYGEGALSRFNQQSYDYVNSKDSRMLMWYTPISLQWHMGWYLPSYTVNDLPYPLIASNPVAGNYSHSSSNQFFVDYTHPKALLSVKGFFTNGHDTHTRLRPYVAWGVQGAMLDYGEYMENDALCYNGRTAAEMHNRISYDYAKVLKEAWDSFDIGGQEDGYVLFQRSGTAGTQKFVGQFLGDQNRSFEGLKDQLHALISLGAGGFNIYGGDMNGFMGNNGSEELYIRWAQFSSMNPLMRSHGNLLPSPWDWDNDGKEDANAKAIFPTYYWLRMNMQDALYSAAIDANKNALPMVQAMGIAYQDQEAMHAIDDQYMFVNNLLVAPVTETGVRDVTKRMVVLPQGNWYDWFTTERVEGGSTITRETPLAEMPLYLKSGAALAVELPKTMKLMENMGPKATTPRYKGLVITPPDATTNNMFYDSEDSVTQYTSKVQNAYNFTVSADKKSDRKMVIAYGVDAKSVKADGVALKKLSAMPDVTKGESGYYTDGKLTYILVANDWNKLSVENANAIPVKPTAGWANVDGKWYYVGEDGEYVVNKWMKDSKGWVYLGADGAMVTNKWVKDSKGWCFVGADGYAVTNTWKKDSVGWCYLDANGSQVKSKWVQTSGKWYYIDANGYMVTNKWQKDSKGWCYVGADGAMVTNKWVKDSKGWCYIGANGYAVTNTWKKDSKGWCYLDANGSQVKAKWINGVGKWYYIDAQGYMVAGKSMKIGNKTYKFNASGVCTNP